LKDCVWWGCQLVSYFESRIFFVEIKKKYKKKHRRYANEQEKRNVFRTKEIMEIKIKDQVIRKERRKGSKEEIKKWKALLISNTATCV
jgi:hypothetical protein